MPLLGTSGDDNLIGTDLGDDISGLGGNDFIDGLDGSDTIHGDEGNDTIHAGAGGFLGIDWIYDGTGDDTVFGETDMDVIYGSAGNDTYDGGTGTTSLFGLDLDSVRYESALAGIIVDLRLSTGQVRSVGGADAAAIGIDTLIDIEEVYGSNFDDLMTAANGFAGNAALFGQGGNDTLTGGAGADVLSGGVGNDLIDGAGGRDMALYRLAASGVTVSLATTAAQDTGEGIDTLVSIEDLWGSPHNDLLIGNGESNYLFGEAGNDILVGGAGFDILEGFTGDDIYVFESASDHAANEISDIEGIDEVRFAASVASTFTLSPGEDGIERIVIGTGLSANADTGGLAALNVDASLASNGLMIVGNDGANTLLATAFDDNLAGNDGSDVLEAAGGNDVLNGGGGDDILAGGSGSDIASYAGAAGGVTVDLRLGGAQDTGFAGIDTLSSIENLVGSAFADSLTGNSAANELDGLEGRDRLVGYAGNDTLDGGSGADTMRGGVGDDIYVVDHSDDLALENANEGVDLVYSSVNYRLREHVENLNMTGSAVRGYGNAADNRLVGNDGNNILDGDAGSDAMRGGLGNDTYYVDNAGDRPIENAGEGTDSVFSSISFTLASNIENLTITGTAVRATGNASDNRLVGNDGANVLNGGAGSDVMRGGLGNDTYYVGEAGDTVIEASGAGRDRVYTNVDFTLGANVEDLFLRGSDPLSATGNSLDNVLRGNGASNELTGGAGADDLRGGGGADSFVFADGDFGGLTASTSDRIIDFSHAEGDVIDLTGVDANSLLADHQAFDFIGTNAFSNVAGQLRFEQVNGNTYVYGDIDGDGIADLMIRLDGSQTLVVGDFIL